MEEYCAFAENGDGAIVKDNGVLVIMQSKETQCEDIRVNYLKDHPFNTRNNFLQCFISVHFFTQFMLLRAYYHCQL